MLIAEELERMVRQSLLDICRTCSLLSLTFNCFHKAYRSILFRIVSDTKNCFKLILTLQATRNNFLCRADLEFPSSGFRKRGKTLNACDVPWDNFLRQFLMQIMFFYDIY